MKLQPLGDRIIVEPIEETSKSGFVVPETMDKEKPQRGKIVSCGPGKRDDNGNVVPMNVKVGDVIIFRKYAPDEFKIDKEEFMILSESDVIAVVK
ncbi:co-chaperone GroES [Patescibacteria group bacterium]|nr:co-chaperone GroES [Patescibacteria group bacterium]